MSAAAVQAQRPSADPQTPNQPPPAPQTDTRAASAQVQAATLTGCLYLRADIPGRTPNVVERAGVLEDYILAETTMPGQTAARGATPGATGTSGTAARMYKVENIDDTRLHALVGKRVEVTGRIDPEGRTASGAAAPQPDGGLGPDQVNLPEFEATSIREVSGTCAPKPSSTR